MTRILRERLRVVREDGKRRLVVLDDDGEIAHDPISGKDLSPEGFIKKLKQSGDEDHAFAANNGSGSGTGQDQGAPRGGASRRFTQSEWQEKLATADAAERKKLVSDKFAGRITVTPA